MKNKLSIIIPTWNTAAITLKCIQSIKKYLPPSGQPPNPQIIVVDNASTDNTLALLQKENITLIKNSKNLGFAKACNIGAKKAIGDYLLFLNSDMELPNHKLIDMLKFLQKNPRIGAIGPQFLNCDKTIQDSVFPPQTLINAFKKFWLNQKTYSKYTPKRKKPSAVWAVSGGAILIKKKLFEKIGGWNEKYLMYFEDLDLCRALHRHHKQIYYYPPSKIIHRHGASGKNLADSDNQWRRLIPGAKKYHGLLTYYLIWFIIKTSQKWQKPN